MQLPYWKYSLCGNWCCCCLLVIRSPFFMVQMLVTIYQFLFIPVESKALKLENLQPLLPLCTAQISFIGIFGSDIIAVPFIRPSYLRIHSHASNSLLCGWWEWMTRSESMEWCIESFCHSYSWTAKSHEKTLFTYKKTYSEVV